MKHGAFTMNSKLNNKVLTVTIITKRQKNSSKVKSEDNDFVFLLQ